MSLYGSLIKQEADYTSVCDQKIPECEKLVQVIRLNINPKIRLSNSVLN